MDFSFLLKPLQAISWFRRNIPRLLPKWSSIVKSSEKRAKEISNAAKMDLISQVMNNIDVAIENGVSQDDFREDMINTIENQWGLTPKPNRLDMIFRNNVLNAYNEGRQQIIDEARDTHPYLRFDAVLDDRTTVICRTCNGVVLPANHSWWDTHTPILHPQCRSILVPLTEAEALAHGITSNPPTIEPEDGYGLRPDQQLDLYLDKKEGTRNPILSGLTTLSSMGLPDFWLFDESKIKRDERGRFASKSGAEHAAETEKFLEKRVKARKPVELGKHVKEVSGDGQEHHEAILGQFHKLGLSPLLRKFPIENMHISKSLEYKDKEGKTRNPNGIYSHEKGQLKIKIPRDEKSFGKDFIPGETHSISKSAKTMEEAVARTATHEIAHHMWDATSDRLKNMTLRAYKRGNPISSVAAQTPGEYFAETFAAYKFHPNELKQHDPVGWNLMQHVMHEHGLIDYKRMINGITKAKHPEIRQWPPAPKEEQDKEKLHPGLEDEKKKKLAIKEKKAKGGSSPSIDKPIQPVEKAPSPKAEETPIETPKASPTAVPSVPETKEEPKPFVPSYPQSTAKFDQVKDIHDRTMDASDHYVRESEKEEDPYWKHENLNYALQRIEDGKKKLAESKEDPEHVQKHLASLEEKANHIKTMQNTINKPNKTESVEAPKPVTESPKAETPKAEAPSSHGKIEEIKDAYKKHKDKKDAYLKAKEAVDESFQNIKKHKDIANWKSPLNKETKETAEKQLVEQNKNHAELLKTMEEKQGEFNKSNASWHETKKQSGLSEEAIRNYASEIDNSKPQPPTSDTPKDAASLAKALGGSTKAFAGKDFHHFTVGEGKDQKVFKIQDQGKGKGSIEQIGGYGSGIHKKKTGTIEELLEHAKGLQGSDPKPSSPAIEAPKEAPKPVEQVKPKIEEPKASEPKIEQPKAEAATEQPSKTTMKNVSDALKKHGKDSPQFKETLDKFKAESKENDRIRAETKPTIAPAQKEEKSVTNEDYDAHLPSLLESVKQWRAEQDAKKAKTEPKPVEAPKVEAKPAIKPAENVAKPAPNLDELVAKHSDPSFGITPVHKVVDDLMNSHGLTKQQAHDHIMDLARKGEMELRPEGGMGLLSPKEQELSIPGPRGSTLSWMRDMKKKPANTEPVEVPKVEAKPKVEEPKLEATKPEQTEAKPSKREPKKSITRKFEDQDFSDIAKGGAKGGEELERLRKALYHHFDMYEPAWKDESINDVIKEAENKTANPKLLAKIAEIKNHIKDASSRPRGVPFDKKHHQMPFSANKALLEGDMDAAEKIFKKQYPNVYGIKNHLDELRQDVLKQRDEERATAAKSIKEHETWVKENREKEARAKEEASKPQPVEEPKAEAPKPIEQPKIEEPFESRLKKASLPEPAKPTQTETKPYNAETVTQALGGTTDRAFGKGNEYHTFMVSPEDANKRKTFTIQDLGKGKVSIEQIGGFSSGIHRKKTGTPEQVLDYAKSIQSGGNQGKAMKDPIKRIQEEKAKQALLIKEQVPEKRFSEQPQLDLNKNLIDHANSMSHYNVGDGIVKDAHKLWGLLPENVSQEHKDLFKKKLEEVYNNVLAKRAKFAPVNVVGPGKYNAYRQNKALNSYMKASREGLSEIENLAKKIRAASPPAPPPEQPSPSPTPEKEPEKSKEWHTDNLRKAYDTHKANLKAYNEANSAADHQDYLMKRNRGLADNPYSTPETRDRARKALDEQEKKLSELKAVAESLKEKAKASHKEWESAKTNSGMQEHEIKPLVEREEKPTPSTPSKGSHYAEGSTYEARYILKDAGFKWNGEAKRWEGDSDAVAKFEDLRGNGHKGVNINPVNQPTPPASPPNQPPKAPQESPSPNPEKPNDSNGKVTEEKRNGYSVYHEKYIDENGNEKKMERHLSKTPNMHEVRFPEQSDIPKLKEAGFKWVDNGQSKAWFGDQDALQKFKSDNPTSNIKSIEHGKFLPVTEWKNNVAVGIKHNYGDKDYAWKHEPSSSSNTHYAAGNTYQAREILKRAGFSWNGLEKRWEGDSKAVEEYNDMIGKLGRRERRSVEDVEIKPVGEK